MDLDLSDVDVAGTVGHAADAVRDRFRENDIILNIDLSRAGSSFRADGHRVTQILFNLLSNAANFAPAGSTVNLKAIRGNGEMVFSVADHGPGIAPGEIDRLFERFETNPSGGRQSGAGLGLSIVRSFVELHGGKVEIQSGSKGGTTVVCRFPLAVTTGPRRRMSLSPGGASGETRTFVLDLPGEAATIRLAGLLAPLLGTGDVVALSGPLGAGKTTFARALIRAVAGDDGLDVPSPTYTLVQIYPTRPRISHFDLYRIADPDELVELGFDEAAETGIVLAEWPSQAPEVLRAANLHLTLADTPGGGRQATIAALPEAAARIARPLALQAFLDAAGEGDAMRAPFPGDASARRYEVLTARDGRPLVLMDAPDLVLGPPVRDGRAYAEIARSARNTVPFVAMAEALRARGLVTPRIEAFDTTTASC